MQTVKNLTNKWKFCFPLIVLSFFSCGNGNVRSFYENDYENDFFKIDGVPDSLKIGVMKKKYRNYPNVEHIISISNFSFSFYPNSQMMRKNKYAIIQFNNLNSG